MRFVVETIVELDIGRFKFGSCSYNSDDDGDTIWQANCLSIAAAVESAAGGKDWRNDEIQYVRHFELDQLMIANRCFRWSVNKFTRRSGFFTAV